MVRTGLEIDALDALPQEERRRPKRSLRETDVGGRGTQIGAGLVLRFERLAVCSDGSAPRDDGLAARPGAEGLSLDCFETDVSRVRVHGSQSGRSLRPNPIMLSNFRVDRSTGRFCS